MNDYVFVGDRRGLNLISFTEQLGQLDTSIIRLFRFIFTWNMKLKSENSGSQLLANSANTDYTLFQAGESKY